MNVVGMKSDEKFRIKPNKIIFSRSFEQLNRAL